MSAGYGGCLAWIFSRWIRKNYVLSGASTFWSSLRILYLLSACIASNVMGIFGVVKLLKLFNQTPPLAYLWSSIVLSGVSNGFLMFWLLLGYFSTHVLREETRFLRSRMIDHVTAIPVVAGLHRSSKNVIAKRKMANKITKVVSTSPEANQQPKEISLKELVAKQMAARGALSPMGKMISEPAAAPALMPGPAIAAAVAAAVAAAPTGGVHHSTSKDSLGNDYYDMMTAKGKVTSISQYFSGVPKIDKETLELYKKGAKEVAQPVAVSLAPSAAPSAAPSTAPPSNAMLTAPVSKQQTAQKTAKRTQSSASVASTGSDYYAAMIKEGKIPKIGSISQYGALLR